MLDAIERLRNAVLMVLKGELPKGLGAGELGYLWQVAHKMEGVAKKFKSKVIEELAPHALNKDEKPRATDAYTIRNSAKRLSWEADTVRGLLSSRGLPPEMGLDVVFVPSPSKVEDLLNRGFLTTEDVEKLERSTKFVSVKPNKEAKAALDASWAGFTGAESADEDE